MILRKGETKILVRGVDEILCVSRKEYKTDTWFRMAAVRLLIGHDPLWYYEIRPHKSGIEIVFGRAFSKQQTLRIEANKHMVL